jgi:glycosyltransferase involved in cell wall biosynthesis
VLAGGYRDDAAWVEEAARQALGKQVSILFNVPPRDMPDLYRSADLFVFPSIREAQGIVLLEAASCGVPCVVHDHPVFRYSLGELGIYSDMTRPGALADTLARLDMDDIAVRKTPLRQRMLEQFDDNVVMPQFINMYKAILADRNSPAT